MICKSYVILNFFNFCGHSVVIISDESWHAFLKRFATSVQHITRQDIGVKQETSSLEIVKQELEMLRAKVDQLTDEVKYLRLHKIIF